MSLKDNEIKRFKNYSVSKNYTDNEFNIIYDLFCTYRSRGGELNFSDFAWIPIKHNPGNNIDNEQGIWVKYIRQHLADNWNNIVNGIY